MGFTAIDDQILGGGVADFLDLSDVPGSYTGYGGYTVKVNSGETALVFMPSIEEFVDLDDVPSSYSGQGGKYLRVNTGETALEFVSADYGSFLDLEDSPDDYVDYAGYFIRVNATEDGVEFAFPTFLNLTDTPASYSGSGGYFVKVNPGATALVFSSETITHNMLDDGTHLDTVDGTCTAGDLIYANTTPKWTRLAVGGEGKILEVVSGAPAWGRKITIGDAGPTGGSDGDIHFEY